MPLAAGSRLDSYEIIALLGAGGMGEVYRARDLTLKREVAIKVLPAYWAREPDRLRRFELEAQSTAALNHPNWRGLALKCGCSTDTRSRIPGGFGLRSSALAR